MKRKKCYVDVGTDSSIHQKYESRGGLNNSKIYNAWDLVVGPKFADAIISKFYRDKKLVCKINSPLIKHELIIKRREIARKINQIVGEDAIKELLRYFK